MPTIFKHPNKQKEFDQVGYTSLPLLTETEIGLLLQLYRKNEIAHKAVESKFKSTTTTGNEELIAATSKQIIEIVGQALQRNFTNYNVLGASFILKEPGNDSAVGPHQDWTYVDEAEYVSFNLWVALTNVDEQNGCLWFLPYSHKIISTLRPSPNYTWPYAGLEPAILKLAKPAPLQAGSCVCFNNATIHGSYANNSPNTRISVVLTLYNQQAKLLHYFIPDDNNQEEILRYEVTPSAFMQIKKGSPPQSSLPPSKIRHKFEKVSLLKFWSRITALRLFSALKV